MIRKLFAGSAAVSLCFGSATPALGQEYRFSGFDGPQGAHATIAIRVRLGGTVHGTRPSLGLTLGYGREMGGPDADGRRPVRQIRVADFRLDRNGVRSARLAAVELVRARAQQSDSPTSDEEYDYEDEGNKKNYVHWVLVLVFGLGVYVIVSDDGGEDEAQPDEPSVGPTNG